MANSVLSYQNWIDLGTAQITAGSEEAGLRAAYVASSIVYEECWQTQGATSSHLTVDWLADREVGVVALAGLTLGEEDTVRLRLSSTDPEDGDLLDTGALTAGVAEGYDLWCHVLAGAVSPRFLRLDIDAPSRAAENFFRVGRAWAGPALSPRYNHAWGYTEEWEDASEIVTAPYSGAEYVNVKPRRRRVEFAYEHLSQAEANDDLKEFSRVSGTRQQVLFVPDPASPRINREAVIGRMQQTTPIRNPQFATWAKTFVIRQSL